MDVVASLRDSLLEPQWGTQVPEERNQGATHRHCQDERQAQWQDQAQGQACDCAERGERVAHGLKSRRGEVVRITCSTQLLAQLARPSCPQSRRPWSHDRLELLGERLTWSDRNKSAVGRRGPVLVDGDEICDHDHCADGVDDKRKYDHGYSSSAVMRWMIRLPMITRNVATPSSA